MPARKKEFRLWPSSGICCACFFLAAAFQGKEAESFFELHGTVVEHFRQELCLFGVGAVKQAVIYNEDVLPLTSVSGFMKSLMILEDKSAVKRCQFVFTMFRKRYRVFFENPSSKVFVFRCMYVFPYAGQFPHKWYFLFSSRILPFRFSCRSCRMLTLKRSICKSFGNSSECLWNYTELADRFVT